MDSNGTAPHSASLEHNDGSIRFAIAGALFFLIGVLLSAVFHQTMASDGRTAIAIFACTFFGAFLLFSAKETLSQKQLLAIIITARVFLWFGAPNFSDDIYRYVHEARATRLGIATPYAIPPAKITPPPDDGISAKVNHPAIAAAYPPFSQLVLFVVVGVGDLVGGPIGLLRAFFTFLDIAVIFALLSCQRRWPYAFLLYGLHPIPLLEAVLNSHLDILGVALMVISVFVVWRRRELLSKHVFWGGALIGLAAGVKPTAILALLALPLRPRRLGVAIAGVLFGVLLPMAPYLAARAPLASGITQYVTRWEAQPTGYAVVSALVAPNMKRRHAQRRYTQLYSQGASVRIETAGKVVFSIGDAGKGEPLLLDDRIFSRGLALALFAMALAAILYFIREPIARTAAAFAALWFFAPTVHPWYFLWVLPFAAATRQRALLLWAAATPLAYEVVIRVAHGAPWHESVWPRLAAAAMFLVGLVLDRMAAANLRDARRDHAGSVGRKE